MLAELKKLSNYVDTFGEEIQRTHLSYLNDKDGAKYRAKQIIEDIIENGLEQTTNKFKKLEKTSYIELCNKFSIIILEYHHNFLCGGDLRWILE